MCTVLPGYLLQVATLQLHSRRRYGALHRALFFSRLSGLICMEHARVGCKPPAFREGACFGAASGIEERALAPRSLQAVNGKTINNGEIRNKSCSSVSSLLSLC
jgi:hypothetical protein